MNFTEMNNIKSFNEWLNEKKKPAGAPEWKDSDAPDAEGRFRDLSIKDLAAWLIKTRKKDVKKISGRGESIKINVVTKEEISNQV